MVLISQGQDLASHSFYLNSLDIAQDSNANLTLKAILTNTDGFKFSLQNDTVVLDDAEQLETFQNNCWLQVSRFSCELRPLYSIHANALIRFIYQCKRLDTSMIIWRSDLLLQA